MDSKPTDQEFFQDRLWLGFKRWTWIKVAFAILICTTFLGFRQQAELRQQDRTQAVQKSYDLCVAANNQRQLIVEIVTSGNNAPKFDVTLLPSFSKLDPDTKAFLIELQVAQFQFSTGDSGFVNRALELITFRNCEDEYPKAEHSHEVFTDK